MESSHLVIFWTSGKVITKFNVLRCISLSETLFWTGVRGGIPITLRIFKLEFYFMKKCSCRESNSIESTVSYPLDHQDNDAGKCNFLVIIF